jgi:tripartite-type tricarboxylate transporter receptor subunit TctC
MSKRSGVRAHLHRISNVLAIGMLALCSASSFAQEYPTRPVTIVVPFGAGGSADVYGRIIAQQLQLAFKQSFIIDNRAGAGSIIGSQYVAQSPPDGYTLLLISNTHVVNETLFPKKSFKLMRDFVPVGPINSSDLVLVTNPKLGVDTVADLIKLAKSKPGSLTYASAGYGTPYHMAGELFKEMAGISLLHVPYKDSSQARTDVIGGQVDMMFDATTTMEGFIRGGQVKAIATSGDTRSQVLPKLPTVSEAGVPKYKAVIWLGLMAPKNTPPAIVDKLNAALAKIVAKPEIRAAWEKQGAVPKTMTQPEFAQFLNDEIKKWAEVVRVSGAKAD